MKIANSLLIFLLTFNLSWTLCHASEYTKELEEPTSSILSNKYVQETALALGASFIAYKYLIAPSIKNCHEILLNACTTGNLLLIKLFHLLGAEQITKHGDTYLNTAYENDHLNIVKYLLDIPPYNTHKPFIAHLLGDQLMLDDCIKNNPHQCISIDTLHPLYKKICIKTQKSYLDGDTLLHMACRNGDKFLVTVLLNNNADINAQDNRNDTCLHIACEKNNLEMVRLLVDRDAKLDMQNNDNYTPLHVALWDEYLKIAEILISRGNPAALTKVGHGEMTPLHIACFKGSLDAVKLLLKGADQLPMDKSSYINAKSINGYTPAHWAYKHPSIIKELIAHGADITINNHDGRTLLHQVCLGNNLETLKLLLSQKNININLKDQCGDTGLHIACKNGCVDLVKFLIQNGANKNEQKNNGSTPLHEACSKSHYSEKDFAIIKLLVENNADVNIPNNNGETPLHIAIANDSIKGFNVIKYLIKNGADLTSNDHNDRSAYQLLGDKNQYIYHNLRMELHDDTLIKKIILFKSMYQSIDLPTDVQTVIAKYYILKSPEARMWKHVLSEINPCKSKNSQECQKHNVYLQEAVSHLKSLPHDPDNSALPLAINTITNNTCPCKDENSVLASIICKSKDDKHNISTQLTDYKSACILTENQQTIQNNNANKKQIRLLYGTIQQQKDTIDFYKTTISQQNNAARNFRSLLWYTN